MTRKAVWIFLSIRNSDLINNVGCWGCLKEKSVRLNKAAVFI
jgi:hypothetical protein